VLRRELVDSVKRQKLFCYNATRTFRTQAAVRGCFLGVPQLTRRNEPSPILVAYHTLFCAELSSGMPYYIGGDIPRSDRPKMAVQTPQSLRSRLNLDVRTSTSVQEIHPAENKVIAVNLDTLETYEESYDHLVLTVGAAPLKPPIPGIDRPGLFALRNLQDMDAIMDWIDQKQGKVGPLHCVVAGAGFVGLEMVEQLHQRGFKVSLVEMMPQILGPLDVEMAAYLQRDLEERGVDVITNDGINEFVADASDPEATVVRLSSGRILSPAHLTILGLGVRPDTDVVKAAGVDVHPRGHILVNDKLQTTVPNIWAAGDSVLVKNPLLPEEQWAVPLAGPANRQGRMVADNIFGKNRSYKGTYGVSIVRSFNLYAACAGMNEKLLKQKDVPNVACVHIHPNSHAGYYPGASTIHLKLIFDKVTGKIYGAQAVGKDGVDKRIDVIATAMQGNLTVEDLAELELCYAPPVGSAKDPVNYIGMVAQNIVEGLVSDIEWNDLENFAKDPNTLILDVRNPGEVRSSGSIAHNAVHIPLDDLRGRLHELPKEKHIVVSCASGQRAYYACRILTQNGFESVHNLDGAFSTFHTVHPQMA
jgi:NADPH-dependent 2,4-dienoyl-CoA reductase/sulfur reductase-like enzyme/rhodanese-related sulfurtransferase